VLECRRPSVDRLFHGMSIWEAVGAWCFFKFRSVASQSVDCRISSSKPNFHI